jgi:glycosyltransferase involved in cell wall biosynthesis
LRVSLIDARPGDRAIELSSRSARAPLLAFATLGVGSNEEDRLLTLLRDFPVEPFRFDRAHKVRSFWKLLAAIRRERLSLAIMEGTGVSGGLALLLGRLLWQVPYVVSSGDAVGPWVGTRSRVLAPFFGVYERLLCRFAAGFIGWTPYLAGRALTFGAPRAITAAGWAPFPQDLTQRAAGRARIRENLQLSRDTLVVGIVGSLAWSRRYGYCYGYELVRAMESVTRRDVTVLIVGDGDGRARLEVLAAPLGGRVKFTGRVAQDQVPDFLAAMDVASLPQSVDCVGSFRYTTKLSEYLAAGLPVVTGQIPLAYDLDDGWLWRLPGPNPWHPRYYRALADLLNQLTPEDLAAKRSAVPVDPPEFDRDRQIARVTAFVRDLLSDRAAARPASKSRAEFRT